MTSGARVLGQQSTSLQCGVSEQHITVPADVPGGAAMVQLVFSGPDGSVLAACVADIGYEVCD
ncbi:hypothetical protein [Amycolatopsis sp. lyj-346]|uniref:hypothetical protein n=1 Tax=Amycolatopsis sp. lyj-346 TaxID=2789289 RepID=UPI00397BB76D